MRHCYPLVADVIASMSQDELDVAICALTLQQRECLLRGDVEAAVAVTTDLELCLSARNLGGSLTR